MKKSIFTFFLSFFSLITFAQSTGNIQGYIVSQDKQELDGISVALLNTKSGTRTAQDGSFILSGIPAGSYTMNVTGIGFKAEKQMVVVEAGNATMLNLALDYATQTLKDVVVRSRIGRDNVASVTRTNTPLRDIPQNIQLIDKATISDQQVFTVDEALKNAAGVTAANFFGGFNYRGFTSGPGLTNGIVGSPYPEGQSALLGNVESIEVIHGPTAILYGQGRLGGTVNLVTKQPKKYMAVNASITAGSFDLYRFQQDVSGSINKKKTLYFLLGGAYQKGGKFTNNFESETVQVYGSLKYELSRNTSWQINANYVNDDASNNYQPRVPIYNTQNKDSVFLVSHKFNPGGRDTRYRGSNYQLQSIMEHRFSTNWKLGLLAAFSKSDTDRNQYFASGFVRVSDNTVNRSYTWQRISSPQSTVNLYVNGQVKTGGIKHSFTVGPDLIFSRNFYPKGILQFSAKRISVTKPVYSAYDTTGMTLFLQSETENFTYNTLGAYIMDQIEITPKLKLLAGLRYNNYFMRYHVTNQTYDRVIFKPFDERPLRTENFSPRLGVVYQPQKTISIYADYNEGFVPQYGNVAEYGGPFEPETSRQYEVGAKGEFFNARFQPFIAIYQITKKNVLQSAPTPSSPYFQVAIGEVQGRGIELGTKGAIGNHLFLIANYSYNKTKITQSKDPKDLGQIFSNSPQNTANAWVKYSARGDGLSGLYFGGGFQYVDMRYFSNKKVDNPLVLQMPAYTLVDAFIGYRLAQYSFQVNGNNLFDKRYALSGATNAYVPGMPRNIMATISCAFR